MSSVQTSEVKKQSLRARVFVIGKEICYRRILTKKGGGASFLTLIPFSSSLAMNQ